MKLTDNFKALPGIYIFTNLVNGKIYVGESRNIKKRLSDHLSKKNQTIHSALKKYGIQNFEIYIEYLPNFKKADLVDLEEQLIKRFDSLAPKGYNLSPRGNSWEGHTQESKLKISKSIKGRKRSKETCEKVGEKLRGRKRSEEVRKKISEKGISGLRGIVFSKTTGFWYGVIRDTNDKIIKTKQYKSKDDAIVAYDILSISIFNDVFKIHNKENFYLYQENKIPIPQTFSDTEFKRSHKYIHFIKEKKRKTPYFRVFFKRKEVFYTKTFPSLSLALEARNNFLINQGLSIPD